VASSEAYPGTGANPHHAGRSKGDFGRVQGGDMKDKEKIEFWGFRKPQGQVAVFSADQVEEMRNFVVSGGTIEIRFVTGPGTVGGFLPDFEIR
jgi:hypothetical protein